MRHKYFLMTLLIIFSSYINVFSSDTLKTQNQIKVFNVADPNEIILKYQASLSEETKLHREYLENLYNRLSNTLIILGASIAFFLAFLGIKTSKDVKIMMAKKFESDINKQINAKLKEYDESLKEYKEALSEIDCSINEVQERWGPLSKMLFDLSGPKTSEKIPQIDLRKLKDKNILWIDDKSENNKLPIKIFREAGTVIKICRNSDSGINFLKSLSKPCDLIISNMGRNGNEKAGIDFTHEIRNMGINTPIIILTRPLLYKKYKDEAILAGAKDCVTDYGQLLYAVKTILGE